MFLAAGCPVVGTLINPRHPEGIANQTKTVTVSCVNCCNVIATHVCCIAQPPTDPPSPTRASVYGLTEMATIQLQTTHTPMDLTTPILIINFIVLYIWKCYSIMCELLQCDCNMYRSYNEDEGLSNIHDRGRSPRTCIFNDPESELYNRLVPECGGVSDSYWFIPSCPM